MTKIKELLNERRIQKLEPIISGFGYSRKLIDPHALWTDEGVAVMMEVISHLDSLDETMPPKGLANARARIVEWLNRVNEIQRWDTQHVLVAITGSILLCIEGFHLLTTAEVNEILKHVQSRYTVSGAHVDISAKKINMRWTPSCASLIAFPDPIHSNKVVIYQNLPADQVKMFSDGYLAAHEQYETPAPLFIATTGKFTGDLSSAYTTNADDVLDFLRMGGGPLEDISKDSTRADGPYACTSEELRHISQT